MFLGNVNSEAVVQNKLSPSVRTRFLRFVPLDWNPSGWLGLRVELYGCSYSETETHMFLFSTVLTFKTKTAKSLGCIFLFSVLFLNLFLSFRV